MSDLFPISRDDMIAEIEREIGLRNRVYPRWVVMKKITQDKADRQIAVMEAIAELLRREP